MKYGKGAAFICLMLAAFIIFGQRSVQAKEPDGTALIQERSAFCYVEGEAFEDLVLGAKGLIQFVYLDANLSRALSKAHEDLANAKTARYPFPEWLEDGNHFYAKEGRQGQVIFVAELETFKPWEVDSSQFFVGGYRLSKNDILTPSMTNPFGDLPSGSVWHFAFAVPKSEVRPGAEINLGYGEYSVKWKVPK